ncbi:hypothetical protein QFZ54_003669 [Sphingomonas faeni]|nr:hypothetical protein [Sphingomonas faeni]
MPPEETSPSATRHNKLGANFLAGVALVTVVPFWL